MDKVDLQEYYKEESGFAVGKIYQIGMVYYSDDYVEWLEKKLLEHSISTSLKTKESKEFDDYMTKLGCEKIHSVKWVKDNEVINDSDLRICKQIFEERS